MKIDIKPKAETKSSMDAIIERIQARKVVPIIGGAFINDLGFTSHDELVRGWARYTSYPGADTNKPLDLARISQVAGVSQAGTGVRDDVRIKELYINYLKEVVLYLSDHNPKITADTRDAVKEQVNQLSVSEMARRCGFPSLESPEENSLLYLADMGLPLYITTSIHTFLEEALRKNQKKPQSEICQWHDGLRGVESVFVRNKDYVPSPDQPLVYHLHGLDTISQSLVLTEDDYLDFLTNIFRYEKVIHPFVTEALTNSSLTLIGYRLRAWDFRVLFRGVINTRPPAQRMTRIAIQLEEDKTEKEYLEKYLRQVEFEIEWKQPGQFIAEIYQRLGGMNGSNA
jgi:hypothetical protein